MNRDELVNALKNGIVEVNFTKVNGENRIMKSTLKSEYLPPQIDIEEAISKKKNDEVLAVWDIEAAGWRSFRIDSIIGWKP
jgi:hypothetical protein